MFNQLKTRLDTAERNLRQSFGNDFSSAQGRRAAFWHFQLMDHAFLRVLWTNLDEIAPGVWRSNQPSPKRLRRYHAMGIRSIITLRGDAPKSHHLFEVESCENLGITLHMISISARVLAPKAQLLALLDLFDTIEKPFLMHCKSGADRAGLASALYLLHAEGRPVTEAARQLSFRYLHLKNDSTGILDHMLDAYAADIAQQPMAIRDWIESRYDPKALTASFQQARGRGDG
ncbi:phosphatase domain-containing protein [Actibacterium sp. D379-3]